MPAWTIMSSIKASIFQVMTLTLIGSVDMETNWFFVALTIARGSAAKLHKNQIHNGCDRALEPLSLNDIRRQKQFDPMHTADCKASI